MGDSESGADRLEQIRRREEETELLLRRLGSVRPVSAVPLDIRGEALTDGPLRGVGWIGRAHDLAQFLNGVLALERHHDDRPLGHELDQSAEERAFLMDGIEPLRLLLAEA